MTAESLERAFRAYSRRRPFRSFWTEFVSGDRLLVTHPEAILRVKELFVFHGPDGGHRIFAAESVCQLIEQSDAKAPTP